MDARMTPSLQVQVLTVACMIGIPLLVVFVLNPLRGRLRAWAFRLTSRHGPLRPPQYQHALESVAGIPIVFTLFRIIHNGRLYLLLSSYGRDREASSVLQTSISYSYLVVIALSVLFGVSLVAGMVDGHLRGTGQRVFLRDAFRTATRTQPHVLTLDACSLFFFVNWGVYCCMYVTARY